MRVLWDDAKRRAVLNERGVDFAKLDDVFADPFSVDYLDIEHSIADETRFAIIGIAPAYGLVHVVYVETDDDTVRLITARRAEPWMVKTYDSKRS